ncbi:MAG: hypothetical protein PVF37_01830 [Desulfobacterales bacterium]
MFGPTAGKKRLDKSKKLLWQCRAGHRARRNMIGTVADPTAIYA